MESSPLVNPESLHLLELMFQEYPDVVDIKQLCNMLGGISTKTAYKLLQANRIQHFKIGRAYKIPKIQIILYLQILINQQPDLNFTALTH
ncbi:helix-turn-helix domain-containing protein [Paenibacillus camerounensis]|uniref:helix-turn-helix domain-containing protein n=1 Tax=Paenibacillus camerounensis TaxID=1243663 RepID=UPI0005A9FFD9|nr:helix-turn-helix domain-containing protein [Paenibacillus camerounensis]